MDGIDDTQGGDASGRGLQVVQATEEERAAIRAMLSRRVESAPAGAGVGRAAALAWAGLRLAAIVLLAAGLELVLGMETSSTTWVVALRSSLAGLLTGHVRVRPGSARGAGCLGLTAGRLAVLAMEDLTGEKLKG